MGALGITQASDLASSLLDFYIKKGPLLQTMQERPLLKLLEAGKETFPASKDKISAAVQGTVMSDTAGFFAGYDEDDALVFAQPGDVLRAEEAWYEVNAGLKLSWSELKKDGITVSDHNKRSEHAGADAVRIAGGLFKARIMNYMESWARSMNSMLWADGSQDAKQVPGIQAIITETPNVGTTHGLARDTYSWWRHRARFGALGVTANTGPKIAFSKADQTLTKTLRAELRQLRRYGGRPNKALCGSGFIAALEEEVHEKGIYTQQGFANKGSTDLGMAIIHMNGLGEFEYDPTLDTLGFEDRCYIMDTRHLKLWAMKGEDNKLLEPERPYNYAAYFRSMTWTGGLMADQLNCHGLYQTTVP